MTLNPLGIIWDLLSSLVDYSYYNNAHKDT